jgi:hypothetical protein
MGKSRGRAVALALQLVPITLPARAETMSVRLDAPCPVAAAPVEEVAEILRGQLAPLPIVVGATLVPPAATALQVTMDACHSTNAELDIIVRYRDQRRRQRIDLGDVALNARSRTLALALAESVQHALEGRDDAAGDGGTAGSNAAFSPESIAPAAGRAPSTTSKASPPEPTPAPQATERPQPAATAEPASRDPGPKPQEPIASALEAAPFVRYTFKTSTPYLGLDVSVGLQRYGFHLRTLASRRGVQDAAVWQGALLAGAAAEWLRFSRASIRSELELGAALALPKSRGSSTTRSATSPHVGGATYVRLLSPVAKHWFLESELGMGVATSLTAQAYHADLISLSGFFVQTSFGVGWSAQAF